MYSVADVYPAQNGGGGRQDFFQTKMLNREEISRATFSLISDT